MPTNINNLPNAQLMGWADARFSRSAADALLLGASLTITPATPGTALTLNGGTLTGASAPVLNMTQTWNNAATAFTGILLNITDTTSANSSKYLSIQRNSNPVFEVIRASATNTALQMSQADGTIRFNVATNGGNMMLQLFSSGGNASNLMGDGANILAVRNGAVAQTLRVYGAGDSTNGDWLDITKSAAGDSVLSSTANGTGTGGGLQFAVPVAAGAGVAATNVARFVGGTGHLLWNTDNTYDIGATSATRPRNLFVGSSIVAGSGITGGSFVVCGSGSVIGDTARGGFAFSADGVVRLANNAGTDFGRLNFGGATSSFPALKRSTTSLEVKLADDSAYAPFAAAAITANLGTAIPAGGTAGAGLKVSSTANFGVFFGSGTPSLTAAKGSIYLRSDGSGIANRMYVNTDGGTTWTNFVTAA